MKQEYEDLLERPHPISRVRPRMPAAERAAQFSPFAALSGFEELIEQTELQACACAQEPERKEEKAVQSGRKQEKGLE